MTATVTVTVTTGSVTVTGTGTVTVTVTVEGGTTTTAVYARGAITWVMAPTVTPALLRECEKACDTALLGLTSP